MVATTLLNRMTAKTYTLSTVFALLAAALPAAENQSPAAPAVVDQTPASAAAPAAPKVEPSEAASGLSAKQLESLALVQSWLTAKDKPVLAADGQVRFLFGATLPTIICSPLHGTDIALQPGEVIKRDGVHAGDATRWQVAPAVSGPADNETTHVIVKPIDVGISTNIIIATDRRTYHFDLLSRSEDWMPSVGFNYPEDMQAVWNAYEQQTQQKKAANRIPETGEDVTTLDFNYTLHGEAPWKPLRVYNNGLKTIIQMPARMKAAEAPALLVLGEDKAQQIVNYRVLGDRYVVDMLFQQAVLVLGVGRHQVKVTITRDDR